MVGIGIGSMFEGLRLSHSEQIILNEKVSLQSLQLQQKYIDSGLADCDVLNKILENNINELNKKMADVITYEKKALFNQEAFKLQLQDYFLTEIQYLLLAEEIDQQCGQDSVKMVFFYDENRFDTQGDILDYLRKLFGERVLVFSLDSNAEEPMIQILLSSYNITQFPSVVVEEKVFQGHTDVETLLAEICSEFSSIDGKVPSQCPHQKTGLETFQRSLVE